jgi:hypothetical protein
MMLEGVLITIGLLASLGYLYSVARGIDAQIADANANANAVIAHADLVELAQAVHALCFFY